MDSDIRCVGPREMPAKTEEAEKSIAKTTARAAARKAGNFDCLRFPHWLAHWYYLTYENQRKTKNFHVMNDRCVGCGKCASQCPEQAIECKDGYPVWTKEKCTLCLRCLHHCPVCHTIWQTYHEAWAIRASRRKGAGCLKGKRMNIRLGQQAFRNNRY